MVVAMVASSVSQRIFSKFFSNPRSTKGETNCNSQSTIPPLKLSSMSIFGNAQVGNSREVGKMSVFPINKVVLTSVFDTSAVISPFI